MRGVPHPAITGSGVERTRADLAAQQAELLREALSRIVATHGAVNVEWRPPPGAERWAFMAIAQERH